MIKMLEAHILYTYLEFEVEIMTLRISMFVVKLLKLYFHSRRSNLFSLKVHIDIGVGVLLNTYVTRY